MNKLKKCVSVLLLVLLLYPAQAMAAPAIDLDRTASLEIQYKWDDARFDIYRVASCNERATFTLYGEFADYKGDINGCDSAQEWATLAENMNAYIKSNGIKSLRSDRIDDQKCSFFGLPVGLYAVIGHDVEVNGTVYTCQPFFVCLPDWDADNGAWNYNVTAQPKSGTPDTPPEEPPTPPHIPQTGQLWWPVPVLACGGLASLIIGVVRRKGNERK